jgi:hypothetical protein
MENKETSVDRERQNALAKGGAKGTGDGEVLRVDWTDAERLLRKEVVSGDELSPGTSRD